MTDFLKENSDSWIWQDATELWERNQLQLGASRLRGKWARVENVIARTLAGLSPEERDEIGCSFLVRLAVALERRFDTEAA